MKLSPATRDRLVNDFTFPLNAGFLHIYDGSPDATFRTLLVAVPLGTPAFRPASGGIAKADAPPAEILASGQAGWAQLLTAQKEPVADLTIAQKDGPGAINADMVFDRLDLQRGGTFTTTDLVVRLPLRAD